VASDLEVTPLELESDGWTMITVKM